MSAKVIAVANMKGGVGKTTMVVGLAETLAAIGTTGRALSVLVVDLDAQGNASYCIAGDDLLAKLIAEKKTIEEFVRVSFIERKHVELLNYVRPQACAITGSSGDALPLAIVPASTELRLVEREIIHELTRKGYTWTEIEALVRANILKQVEFLRTKFDVIIFDCPPGISIFTEAVLKSSDLILTPVIPDTLSLLGLTAFCNRVINEPRAAFGPLQKPRVVMNRVQAIKIQQSCMADLSKRARSTNAPFQLLNTKIPQSAALAAAMTYPVMAPTYIKKYSNARTELQDLAREIMESTNVEKPSDEARFERTWLAS